METPANAAKKAPKTLLEAVRYFSDLDVATEYVAKLRWPDGPVCPRCGTLDPKHYYLKTRRLWKCRACKKQFSVKVGTIFEDSPLGLDKWLPAVWLIANCKNGISSYELAKDLGIQQKSAWFMNHRIRLAMQTGTFKKLSGEVEADESFVGGKEKFKHASKKQERRSGPAGKTAVFGLIERDGEAKAKVIPNISKPILHREIRENVKPGSTLMTDSFFSYRGLENEYTHEIVDHAIQYVKDNVHTNKLENYFSLLKRTIKGTYVAVDPDHLTAYLDEQTFRFNNRTANDAERFAKTLGSVAGRRLTYSELTGKD
jgi:transposase-like protein